MIRMILKLKTCGIDEARPLEWGCTVRSWRFIRTLVCSCKMPPGPVGTLVFLSDIKLPVFRPMFIEMMYFLS